MAVKMRLMRMGKTKSPHYRVVVIDGRRPRDGRYIEQIGRYDPRQDPSLIDIDSEKAVEWLGKGAQPTEAVRKLLDVAGALTQFKIKSGQIHTVGGAEPLAPTPVPVAEVEPAEVEPAEDVEVSEAGAEEAGTPEAAADTPTEVTPAESSSGEPEAMSQEPAEVEPAEVKPADASEEE